MGGQKDDDGTDFDAAKIAGRAYTGRDAAGRKRLVKFGSGSIATYTGAAGKATPATWSIDGKVIDLYTNTHLYYQVMNEDKICFKAENDASAAPTSSCLVYDEDGDGEVGGAAPPGGAVAGGVKTLVPADPSVTFRDFLNTRFEEEDGGGTRLIYTFLPNKVAQWYREGDTEWKPATWSFFASPARIQVVIDGVSLWMHVVDTNKFCYVGATYGATSGKCYLRK